MNNRVGRQREPSVSCRACRRTTPVDEPTGRGATPPPCPECGSYVTYWSRRPSGQRARVVAGARACYERLRALLRRDV